MHRRCLGRSEDVYKRQEQALMKETDAASAERLEALRQDIAEVQEKLNVAKAG